MMVLHHLIRAMKLISWEPNFTFALRGDEDAEAGTEVIPEDLDEE